jgi:hypothetical protein
MVWNELDAIKIMPVKVVMTQKSSELQKSGKPISLLLVGE